MSLHATDPSPRKNREILHHPKFRAAELKATWGMFLSELGMGNFS